MFSVSKYHWRHWFTILSSVLTTQLDRLTGLPVFSFLVHRNHYGFSLGLGQCAIFPVWLKTSKSM